ncbi:acyl transferase domain-containing protein/thioesterase domain-containing protein [Catenulispora sp. MAP12-49]|uniref:beta-ketoacyl synthase N-terminal-like domain-containing protein n=1 Tax=Catenulispora sp. MAP12-49 TaxID=3156302 RepID=UPI00351912DF
MSSQQRSNPESRACNEMGDLPMGNAGLEADVRRLVLRRLHEWHKIDPTSVKPDRPLAEQGVSSRDAVALAAELSQLAEVRLPATLLWEASTLDDLARVVGEYAGATTPPVTCPNAASSPGAVQIAVVGVGCRLPGAVNSAEEFWRLLTAGSDAVSTLPEDRWQGFASRGDPATAEVTKHGGFLDDLAGFDAEFFGIAPSEAAAMDPQQRLLLEVAYESLDHASIPAHSLASTRTGVFVGVSGNEYAHLTTSTLEGIQAWTAPGIALSIVANRLSYLLDLRGPSLVVDTACSSSLVAVHQAVRSLVGGECDAALAGGVNILLSPMVTLGFQRAGALAQDGRCKTFDAAADGMVRSEGCAVVVLKRLSDAELSGDRVLAVIQSSAVNSDGRSNGLLAPNGASQRALLSEVYARDGVTAAADVDYVEAHGTGTALGDPVEAGALGAVLGRGRDPDRPLLVGSVKTNLGHLEAAAGIAGLVKTVLALHHGELPPSLHFEQPNDHIDFDALSLRVVTGPEPWPRYSGHATAGVSAFGFGGTNAHVVLREYAPAEARPAPDEIAAPGMIALDAPTSDRLRDAAGDLAAWLNSPQAAGVRLSDAAHTLVRRLGAGRHRGAVVARSREQAAEALTRLAAGEPHPGCVEYQTDAQQRVEAGSVWVFSGYGSQWPGMARRLLDEEAAFAAAIDSMEPVLERCARFSLRDVLATDSALSDPAIAQPALFGVQVALASLWRAYGLRPAAMIGHSMGEISAAVAAGALSLEAGAQIIASRSRLLSGLTGGAMAVVGCSEGEIAGMAGDLASIRIAVHSSPEQAVVAGTAADVELLTSRVEQAGMTVRALDITAASHTEHVDSVLEAFSKELGVVTHQEPTCRFYRTAVEDPRGTNPLDAVYWLRNLRMPVRFRQAVAAAAEDGHRVFLEISPHPTQLHPIAETLRATGVEDALLLPTLRRGDDETAGFRLSLAALMLRGDVDLNRYKIYPDAQIIDIPSRRWRHRTYWAGLQQNYVAPEPEKALLHPVAAQPVLSALDRLRACVAQVLGYAPASVDGDTPLTQLGLDSLQAARIVTVIKREFGVEVQPRLLLDAGTVASVAAHLNLMPSASTPRSCHPQPRDMTERMIAQAWQNVGGRPPAGVDDELSELASDSVLAEAFTRAVSASIGCSLDTIDHSDSPITIASLADRLRPLAEAPVEGNLRVLRPGGSRPPLFLIHPAGGTTAVYRPLCDRLSTEQPCFGLERLDEATDVGDRAAQYARLIWETHPDGPWALGGWSYGGIVAQEAARLLVEAGGEVGVLLLIDSVLPLPMPALSSGQAACERYMAFAGYVRSTYGAELEFPYDELALMNDAEQIDTVMGILEKSGALPPSILKHQRDSYTDLLSAERHDPVSYSGRTVLYRASETAPHTVSDPRYEQHDEALGWQRLCRDLTVRSVPGHHLALLDPPVVDVLSNLFIADLECVEREPAPSTP